MPNRLPDYSLVFSIVAAAQLAVNHAEQFVILLVVEHGIMELVRKVLQPDAVADRVSVDNILRKLCSLRICFNSIVDGIILFSQIFLRCHMASRFAALISKSDADRVEIVFLS